MSIPDYQTLMLPLLEFSRDKKEHSLREAVDYLTDKYKLSEEDRKKLLPSGQQEVFKNRVGWARTYMKKAGLLESTRRGYIRITDRGLEILAQSPDRINNKFLDRYEELRQFRTVHLKEKVTPDPDSDEVTAEEALESAYNQLRDNLAGELLQQVKAVSPNLFEKIVVELLLKMGYGGSRKDAGQAIGKSGDEGIDGIIKEDRLGLDVIYLQAKRWDGSVGRPEIQKFVGALHGKRAKKGVFITTGTFTSEANGYVATIDPKVILIDGRMLADLMIDHNLGVSSSINYEIKKIDTDYLEEE